MLQWCAILMLGTKTSNQYILAANALTMTWGSILMVLQLP